MDEFEPDLTGLDQPVPLPDALRARLEPAMLDPLAGLDEPIPLPDALRVRLETALITRRGSHRVLALAAVVLLVAGVVSALALTGSGASRRTLAAGVPPDSSTTAGALPASGPATGASGLPDGGSAAASGVFPATTSIPSTPAAPADRVASGGEPPFAFPPQAAAAPASGPFAASAAPTGPAVRIGVIRGDPAEEAGFAAYLRALAQSTADRIESVDVGPGRPGTGTIATVNLSGVPVATPAGPPSWVTGALVETLLAPEAILHGPVFDFSSAAERQAHLAVDALFPAAAPGATAVIYRMASGVLSSTVPAALAQVLQERGVITTTVVFQPGQPVSSVAAAAAFLSLDPASARSWLQAARGIAFPRGIAGLGDLLDPALAGLLPANAAVVSPYALATGAEAAALGPSPAGAAQLHGWIAAKSLAVALWRSGATTANDLQAALRGLAGYGDALRPPYQVRPGTNSRTPEGLLFNVPDGAFVARGSFRTDPH